MTTLQFDLRQRRILEVLPVARSLAERIARRLPACVDVDDLAGAARMALIEAADRFDQGREVPFEAYARQPSSLPPAACLLLLALIACAALLGLWRVGALRLISGKVLERTVARRAAMPVSRSASPALIHLVPVPERQAG